MLKRAPRTWLQYQAQLRQQAARRRRWRAVCYAAGAAIVLGLLVLEVWARVKMLRLVGWL